MNRCIAEYLALRTHKAVDTKVKKGLEYYRKWRRDTDESYLDSPDYRQFVPNFHRLVHDVERSKVALSRNTSNWSLSSPPSLTFPFRVKRNLFDENRDDTTVHLSTSELLNIFVKQIWPRLKSTIANTISSASAQMSNAPLSVVLLSGGSSGFGWLRELLKEGFASELGEARILHLPEYREVVAKGLAIECARRFYVDQGDFGAVTYNRLCLTLQADERPQTVPRYTAKFGGDRPPQPEGVLLPSSTALGDLIGTPLRWRFRLEHPPRQALQYYFLRSSFDPQDLENLQNIIDHTVRTPVRCSFGSQLQIELTVSKDGTACPRFIYKTGQEGEEVAVSGRPFYLDMTTVGESSPAVAYLGLDFGTSNSALAYLSRETMERVELRGADSSWLSLHELVNALPYPLAKPLRRVIAGAEGVNSKEGAKRVLEFIEACLALLSYAAYAQWCATTHPTSHIFKGFTQRSSGPLWALLKQCLKSLGKQSHLLAPAQRLLQPDVVGQIDDVLRVLVDVKHDKAQATEADLMRAMTLIGNVSHAVFSKCLFGYFESVQKKRFGTNFTGRFRVAHGAAQPFSSWFHVVSGEPFADYQSALVHLETLEVLSLEPLYLWDFAENRIVEDESTLYVFDRQERDKCSFKATGASQSMVVDVTSPYREAFEILQKWKVADEIAPLCKLTSMREEDSQEDMESLVSEP